MKMNTKLVLVLTFMLVVSSCNDSDIIVENANSGISIDKSRQLNLTPDEKLHKEQSSLEKKPLILLSRIACMSII